MSLSNHTYLSIEQIISHEEDKLMSGNKLSAKQQEILEYIRDNIIAKGYPPAVREICVIKYSPPVMLQSSHRLRFKVLGKCR